MKERFVVYSLNTSDEDKPTHIYCFCVSSECTESVHTCTVFMVCGGRFTLVVSLWKTSLHFSILVGETKYFKRIYLSGNWMYVCFGHSCIVFAIKWKCITFILNTKPIYAIEFKIKKR